MENKKDLLSSFIFLLKKKFKENKIKLSLGKEHISRMSLELSFFKKNQQLIFDAIEFLKSKKTGGTLNKPNSFIFYLLGITKKEPDLSRSFDFKFELDKDQSRISPPDIDTDFDERDPIIEYLCGVYGEDHLALIGNNITFKPKAAIQFCAKALDVMKVKEPSDLKFRSENDQEAKRISKIMLNVPKMTLSDWLGENKKFKPPNRRIKEAMEKLKVEEKNYPDIFKSAKKIEGRLKSYGTHAAGVVISKNPIVKDVGLHFAKVKRELASGFILQEKQFNNWMTTQFDMKDIEDLGLLKFDFLQIDTLRQMTLTEELIKERKGVDKLDFDIDNIETNDPKVFKIVDDNMLEGIFQLTGDAIRGKDIPIRDKKTREILLDKKTNKPRTFHIKGVIEIIGCQDFNDIVVSNAIGRPGPLAGDVPKKYREGKDDPDGVIYAHPKLEPILKNTYGCLCISGEMEIFDHKTKKFTKIKDVKTADIQTQNENGDEIIVKNRKVIFNGEKECIRLKFEDGSYIDCTPDHKIWSEFGWVEAKDSIGKYLAFSKKQIIPDSKEKYSAGKARIIGMLLGDGILDKYRVVLCCKDYSYLDFFKKIVNKEFINVQTREYFHCRCNYIAATSGIPNHESEILKFNRKIGIQNCIAKTKHLPNYIFTASFEEKRQMLIGYLDTDGHIGIGKNNRVELSFKTISKRLAYETKKLLYSIGIFSFIYSYQNKVSKENCYQIEIKNKVFFIESILLNSNSLKINKIKDIYAFAINNKSCLEKSKHYSSYDRNKITKYIREKYLSYSKRRMQKEIGFGRSHFLKSQSLRIKESSIKTIPLEGYQDLKFLFLKATSIEEIGKQKVYDILNCGVEKRFNLFNGLVVSNCYQEQLIQMAMDLAGFSFAEADGLRKACGKKITEMLDDIEPKFRKGCKKNSIEESLVDELWQTCLDFGSYAFNKTLSFYEGILTVDGEKTIEELYKIKKEGMNLPSIYEPNGEEISILNVYDHGVVPMYKIKTSDGESVTCTMDHKFLTEDGICDLKRILAFGIKIIKNEKINKKQMPRMLQSFPDEKRTRETQKELSEMGREKKENKFKEDKKTNLSRLFKGNNGTEEFCKAQKEMLKVEKAEISKSQRPKQNKQQESMGNVLPRSRKEREMEKKNLYYNKRNNNWEPGRKKKKIKFNERFEHKKQRKIQRNICKNSNKNLREKRYSISKSFEVKKMERRKSGRFLQKVHTSVEKQKCMALKTRKIFKKYFGSNGTQTQPNDKKQKFLYKIQTQANRFFRQRKQNNSGIRRRTTFQKKLQNMENMENKRRGTMDEGSKFKHRIMCEKVLDNPNFLRYMAVSRPKIQNIPNEASSQLHKKGKKERNCNKNWKKVSVVGCEYVGKIQGFDIEVEQKDHLYCLNNGIITQNSHSTSYGFIGYQIAYLKAYYPTEFICAILTSEAQKSDDKLEESINNFKKEYPQLKIFPPNINKSKLTYCPNADFEIISPFVSIKGIGTRASESIISKRPEDGFASALDFLILIDRSAVDSKTIELLLANDALEEFGNKNEIGAEIMKYERIKNASTKKGKKINKNIINLF